MAEEVQQEALLKKHYYENCPGCKVKKLKESQTGPPIRELMLISFVVMCAALPISSLFPFLYFMITDFHIAEREDDIRYYAGYVGCSFMFGRALTSVFWGIMADRYGRKPVIIMGTIAVVIFNTLFGLSVNFWMATAMRFLLGSLNGLLGPIKAYACEMFHEEYQALGISTVMIAWGIGLIIGPALGGYLAQPAEKFPSIFSEESVFGRFPYFLPCLTISLFASVVSIASCWLPETLHIHHASSEFDESSSKKSLVCNWPLMPSIILYCVFSLHEIAYMEIFSLWAISPRQYGGLSYTSEDVGTVLSISGAGLLIFQTCLYPYLDSLLGPIVVARISGLPFYSHADRAKSLHRTELCISCAECSVCEYALRPGL
ncbi:hypothetical protein BT93_G2049 [Corymbia citriodora subsp. variegata]|nr:hypothetical protein BT93_G2049 [Corymbia citriodora subsp. variegata]